MTIKASYLFWLLVALIAGAWPLALPTGVPGVHATQSVHTASVETNVDA